MKIRNKRNGLNTLAYKIGGVTKSEMIPAGSMVILSDLTDFNQIVNKQDFNRGWFEIINEIEEPTKKESVLNSLDKAKKQAVEYTKENKKQINNK